MRKMEILSFVTKLIDLKGIMLNDTSKREKDFKKLNYTESRKVVVRS